MNKRNYEFFGLSGVGKSFLLKKLINNLELDKRYKDKIFNYKSLLYWDLYKKKKLTTFHFTYWIILFFMINIKILIFLYHFLQTFLDMFI